MAGSEICDRRSARSSGLPLEMAKEIATQIAAKTAEPTAVDHWKRAFVVELVLPLEL
jgi:hypothetical protein